jgi:hypothetical protein
MARPFERKEWKEIELLKYYRAGKLGKLGPDNLFGIVQNIGRL